ncbi:hypothetical protein [Corynebacterium efficiens YS-314]|uniref:Uncharacterized protein n=1 Tax=Corynebacterium efficiens (strain DSM 44549 / YS-314 / AJ 12310 / JCM 11189 / NBRC 100395) TaxID=196164 RepID=Q8FPP5_COREF|nr:hypothetical protein [Corynebacterium efficiens YS-314]
MIAAATHLPGWRSGLASMGFGVARVVAPPGETGCDMSRVLLVKVCGEENQG